MRSRDQLTYDVDDSASRGPVPWVPLLVLVAVLGLVTVLVAGIVRSGGSPESAAAPTPDASSAPVAAPASSSSPLPSGSDAEEGLAAPEGSQKAAAVFVDAWLDPNPKTRQAALAVVSSPALTEELMLTDPANIPRATRRGAPALTEASAYSSQFRQTLSTGVAVQVYLVADPAAQYRWLATSVERA